MAAVLDSRVFKLSLLVAGIALMLSGIGVVAFGTKLGMISADAVPMLSITVWLACALSAVRRWLRSKRPGEPLSDREMALSSGAWTLDPSGSTLYGVLGEADRIGPVQLLRLHKQDGRVPVRTSEHSVVRTYQVEIPVHSNVHVLAESMNPEQG